MDEPVQPPGDSKRAFPGVLDLLHKSVPATFTEDQGKLFVNLLLQLLWILLMDLLKDFLQLSIDPSLRLNENPIKPSKDPDLGHVGEMSGQKFFSAPPAFLTLRLFTVLLFHSVFS
jgi:hypothetical protein